jgi:hypothetical protein
LGQGRFTSWSVGIGENLVCSPGRFSVNVFAGLLVVFGTAGFERCKGKA